MSSPSSRRAFLRETGVATVGLVLFGPGFRLRALETGHRAWPGSDAEYFTPEQLRRLNAVADRILPAGDGFPGAGALGTAGFIDRMVTRLFPEDGEVLLRGLAALDAGAGERSPAAGSFLDLGLDARDEVLRSVEGEEYFPLFRDYTLYASFTLPEHGSPTTPGPSTSSASPASRAPTRSIRPAPHRIPSHRSR